MSNVEKNSNSQLVSNIVEFIRGGLIPLIVVIGIILLIMYNIGHENSDIRESASIEPEDICHIEADKYCVDNTLMYLDKTLKFRQYNSRISELCRCR